jgi:hypothetical protein
MPHHNKSIIAKKPIVLLLKYYGVYGRVLSCTIIYDRAFSTRVLSLKEKNLRARVGKHNLCKLFKFIQELFQVFSKIALEAPFDRNGLLKIECLGILGVVGASLMG